MTTPKLEKFFLKIAFLKEQEDGSTVKPFYYIHNRQVFDELEIPVNTSSLCQFLNVGQVIKIEDFKYKIQKLQFVLDNAIHNESVKFIDDIDDNKYEHTAFNCILNVTVKTVN